MCVKLDSRLRGNDVGGAALSSRLEFKILIEDEIEGSLAHASLKQLDSSI
ncbi:hypothetical protein KKA49_03170 [Patescibacteria group bacterium]|nr:hypothetical protein [Patescibacteria group bacterium]MBU1457152.1 hypothetical protein [Patescibacteria group bacterium]